MDQFITRSFLGFRIVGLFPHTQIRNRRVAPHPNLNNVTWVSAFSLCNLSHGSIRGDPYIFRVHFFPSGDVEKPGIFFVSSCSKNFSENSSTVTCVMKPFFTALLRTLSVESL